MEKLTQKEIIQTLKEIKMDAERLHSGNVAHQRTHIMGTIQWLIDEIGEGEPDETSENSLHKHGVIQPKGDPNCKLCSGKGYYSFSTFDGSTTTTKRCGCLQFGA